MLYYLCWFCPDSSFALSHFLGEPSSIYNKTKPDQEPNQNLGYDFRGVSASSQERYEQTQERSEKRRRSECASALLKLSHQSTDDMLVKADASPGVEVNRVKHCQREITNDYRKQLVWRCKILLSGKKWNWSPSMRNLSEKTMIPFCFILGYQMGKFPYACLILLRIRAQN